MRKRSLLKKFVAAAATAAVLIGAMGTTAAASGYGGTGDTKGSITVHKYSKVTQATTTNPTRRVNQHRRTGNPAQRSRIYLV